MIRFSLSISHTPWRPDRVRALREMLISLAPYSNGVPVFINDTDYRGTDWQVSKVAWARSQWEWHLRQVGTSHAVLMTDDLHIAPDFWKILDAMVQVVPTAPIGLLSNHPRGPGLAAEQYRWYRTNSWIVGPAYVLPRDTLAAFLEYFDALPDGNAPGAKGYGNDDSTLNEFITKTGRNTWHPLPTIIEHRGDLPSTVGHGDRYSRERVSWRGIHKPVDFDDGTFGWETMGASFHLEAMQKRSYWELRDAAQIDRAPLLPVGE